MTEFVLADCVPRDHFGITCVRGLLPDEVLSRLGVTDQVPYPLCTPDEALQLARQAATAVRDVSGRGRYELECACLLRLGDAAMESGEFAGAREAFASLAQLGQARADRPREGSALLRLGDLAKRREQPQEAERNFRQGLAMLEGSEGSIPETIHGLIELTELCGMTLADYPAAEAFGKRALQLCDESGDRGREAEAVVALASAEMS